MDPDDLRDALRRWTDEAVIDDRTADRIREFEGIDPTTEPDGVDRSDSEASARDGETDDSDGDLLTDRRVVVAVALMGGALVAVGVGTFLLERWESIPVVIRAAILLGVPLAAGAGARRLRGRAPRTAHGLWLLAALFTGVTLFQLAELLSVADAADVEAWLWLSWTAVAIALATWIDSRPIGGVATVLGLATLVAAVEPPNPALLVGAYGVLTYVAGLLVGARESARGGRTTSGEVAPRVAATMRWLGALLAVGTLAVVAAAGAPPWADTEPGTLLLTAGAAVAAAVAVGSAWDDRRARLASAPAPAALAALAVAWGVDAAGVGEVGAALIVLASLLVLLLALVVAAVGLGEPALVNVATLGFVAGVLAFLVGPVVDVVSGPLALVAAGLVLLGVGLAAERGRREVLVRIR